MLAVFINRHYTTTVQYCDKLMRQSFSFFCRLLVSFLIMTVLTSGISMAAYLCPELAPAAENMVMDGTPCADMDQEKPVHCAAFQSGNQLALEHLAAPALTPILASFIIPAPVPASHVALTPVQNIIALETGADPPYLRTRRLRI